MKLWRRKSDFPLEGASKNQRRTEKHAKGIELHFCPKRKQIVACEKKSLLETPQTEIFNLITKKFLKYFSLAFKQRILRNKNQFHETYYDQVIEDTKSLRSRKIIQK